MYHFTYTAIYCTVFQAIDIHSTPIQFIYKRAFRGLDEIQELYITEPR